MAWRVTADPAVRRVIERGPSELSRATSASRVSSPSAANTRAWCEGAVKPYAEPGAELFGVGESAPHARARCAQNDLFLDTVCSLMQLHGCILRRPRREMQPTNCILIVLQGTSG